MVDNGFWDLFLNRNVAEIQKLVGHRKSEVEQKKDELRYLVGERHRDVIEASDSIQAMKDLSAQVETSLSSLKKHCAGLNECLKSGCTLQPSKASSDVAMAAHLKLLLELPEMIWSFMDTSDHLSAATLFFVGRHISAKLKLSSEVHTAKVNVQTLVKRLWNSLTQMELAVLSACRRRLSSPPCDTQTFRNSLLAYLLLENGSMERALTEFLSGRKVALNHILGTANGTRATEAGEPTKRPVLSIKKQAALVAKFLLSTLDAAESLFLPSSRETGLRHELDKLRNLTLRDMNWLAIDPLFKHLSEDVLNLRLIPVNSHLEEKVPINTRSSGACSISADDLSLEYVQKEVGDWWLGAINCCRCALGDSLKYVSTLSGLVTVRNCTLRLLSKWQAHDEPRKISAVELMADTWLRTPMTEILPHVVLQRPVDLWHELFQNLFLDRMKDLLNSSLNECFEKWANDIGLILSNYTRKSPHADEVSRPEDEVAVKTDWARLLWTDLKSDTFWLSSRSAISGGVKCNLLKNTKSSNKTAPTSATHVRDFSGLSNMTRLLRPDNMGLVVFCCLAGCPIPASQCAPNELTPHTPSPPAHLLVFLQRLLSRYSANGFTDFVSPLDSIPVSGFERRNYRRGYFAQKLSLLSPNILSVCDQLDKKLTDVILAAVSSANRDWFEIWSLVLTSFENLLRRCHDWTVLEACNKEKLTDINNLSNFPVAIHPCAGLLLTRAVIAFMEQCPSVGAAVITSKGVLEFAHSLSPPGNHTKTHQNASSGEPQFAWSDVSHLRSIWQSACSPLRQLTDRLTLAFLVKAVVTDSMLDKFRRRMKESFILDLSGVEHKVEDANAAVDTMLICHLLMAHSLSDELPDAALPFDEIKLQSNSEQMNKEADQGAVAVLRVPSQASLPLHEVLLTAVHLLSKLAVHMLPKPPLGQEFSLRLCQTLLDEYANLAAQFMSLPSDTPESSTGLALPFTQNRQSRALQLMFDIRFLLRLLIWPVPSGNISAVKEEDQKAPLESLITKIHADSKTLLSQLESFVDPFDWEVCARKLNQLVAENLSVTAHLYAPLMRPSQGFQLDSGRSVASSNSRDIDERKSAASVIPLVYGASDKQRTFPTFTTLPLSLPTLLDRRHSKHDTSLAAKSASLSKLSARRI
ncbi:unnamed protein product [Calicophoron daubneyi]|uniref:Conserved oligomeric Golgi complex subunit 1 n=1 Tax=Calicophoron daubneyi TaxID=300641 RepID=A0AAV2U2K8_CALDB